ncbi:MAG: GH25 family lysozyme [Polyangiaceae bacterium]
MRLLGFAVASLSASACGEGRAPLAVGEAEQAICPAGETTPGIDVSYYQENVDWEAVGAAGMEFAIARSSYGEGFVDPRFDKNWKGIRAAGLVRGAYQFFLADQDPIAQAELLLEQLAGAGGLEPGDLPPALDIEETRGVGDAKIVARMHAWLEHVEAAIGRPPMIYSSPGFWNVLGNPAGFEGYPLWVAHWGVQCPKVPSGSWEDFAIWQEGPFAIDGLGKVDGNWFNGSRADLLAFAGTPAPEDPGGTEGTLVLPHRPRDGAEPGPPEGATGGEEAEAGSLDALPQAGCSMVARRAGGGATSAAWLGCMLAGLALRRRSRGARAPGQGEPRGRGDHGAAAEGSKQVPSARGSLHT